MARIDDARAFLNDPTRVRLYSFEERCRAAQDRRQTDAEYKTAGRKGLSGNARLEYREVPPVDVAPELEKLARRYASTDHCGPSHLDAHADDAFRADLLLKQWERNGWKQLDVTVPSHPDTLVGIP